jgi:CheY-like chemotaxis protein
MPKMTGEQTVRELRNREYGGMVIGVTGYAMSEDVERFVTAGCDEVLPKPLDIKRLMGIISSPPKKEI